MTLVVDAGHGGPDGGAEGADGTLEADLNLAVAKALKKEGEKRGFKVIMTRESEEGLYEAGNLEKKWSKLGDMKARKTTMEQSNAAAVITIHMNCFAQDHAVRGAQTFYPKSGNAEVLKVSEAIAESVQNQLNKKLDDGNRRVHMGKGDVYLLENPARPIVLVECGFLSNDGDLTKLKQPGHQQKLAVCIIDGVAAVLEVNIN
jgi:N-acetylmuramoyl-L-alanine amidase